MYRGELGGGGGGLKPVVFSYLFFGRWAYNQPGGLKARGEGEAVGEGGGMLKPDFYGMH